MKLSKEVKLGIIVTVAIALFIYGFNFLKGRHVFSSQRKFHAVYSNIDGLVEANPILVNGYKVGQVSDLKLLPDNSGRIIATFVIKEDKLNIPKGTIARVISSDLLGSKAIELQFSDLKVYAVDGDTLIAATEAGFKESVNKQIAPLQKKAESLISSIDSVMVVVQAVLNKDARENLSKSFESIKNAIATFEKTALKLDGLMESEKGKISNIFSKVESIAGNLANNNDKLTQVINNFASISDSLAKSNIKSTINNANMAVLNAATIMEKINKGEGTMGMLIKDDKLYKQLDSASANLDKLFEDMRLHPKRYVQFSVFGGKDKSQPEPEPKK